MNYNGLLELLLEENAASWNGKKWIKTTNRNIKGLWVNYLLSFSGGPQFNIYNNDFEFIEMAWTIDQLKEELSKIDGKGLKGMKKAVSLSSKTLTSQS
jgi:hypothetical protein